MSDLVGNQEDRFSHNEAHITLLLFQLSTAPLRMDSVVSIKKLRMILIGREPISPPPQLEQDQTETTPVDQVLIYNKLSVDWLLCTCKWAGLLNIFYFRSISVQ